MDLKRMSLAVAADKKEERCYVKYCRDINMDPSWVGKTFKNKLTNQLFTLKGLEKKGPLFRIVITSKYGNNEIKLSYPISQFMNNCIIYNENENTNEN